MNLSKRNYCSKIENIQFLRISNNQLENDILLKSIADPFQGHIPVEPIKKSFALIYTRISNVNKNVCMLY